MDGPTLIFDLETKRLASEVGGWHNVASMGMSCAVTLDMTTGEFRDYLDADAPALVADLRRASLVVGFNIRKFDYAVLQAYTAESLNSIPTLDICEVVSDRLGFRVTLDALARGTLGTSKTADGFQAVRWFREGQMDKLLEYCRQDVNVTRELYEFARANKHLRYYNRTGKLKIVQVTW